MKDFLRTVPWLSKLGDEEIELLARTAEERRYPEGTHIVRKGEPGSSAFILKDGAAETRLEKPTGAPLHLSTIGPGELFGELALIDGEPRSASVIATQDTTVIEISRDMFLREVSQHPTISLRLIGVVAKRLRRAESIVSDFSERIYGDVLPRLQEAVSAQLDAAKTICEQSKARAESTTEQAKHILDITEQRWTTLTRIATFVGGGLALVAAVITFFGFDEYRSFKELIKDKKSEAREIVEEIDDERDYLKVLKETSVVFDKLRLDLQLEERADISAPRELPSHAAKDFLVAHQRLLDDYLGQAEDWPSEVALEALEVLAGIKDRGYIRLVEADWDKVIDAIEYAVKTPPEHWLQRQRLNYLVDVLHSEMTEDYSTGARALVKRIEGLLESKSQKPRQAAQTALILARLGDDEEPVIEALQQLQKADSPWRRNRAAVALITLGEAGGWETLRKDLVGPLKPASSNEREQELKDRKTAAFAAALLLGESAVYPPKKRSQARYVKVEELDRQLSLERLSKYVNPPPDRVGVELISQAILNGLSQSPRLRSRFFWQYCCNVLCGLGCNRADGKGGGSWCTQCLDDFSKEYVQSDRAGESCAVGHSDASLDGQLS